MKKPFLGLALTISALSLANKSTKVSVREITGFSKSIDIEYGKTTAREAIKAAVQVAGDQAAKEYFGSSNPDDLRLVAVKRNPQCAQYGKIEQLLNDEDKITDMDTRLYIVYSPKRAAKSSKS